MADLIGPFDSADWAQTEWYNFAPTWAPPGIIGSPASSIGVGDFAVTASGLTLTVACNGDRAWIDGSGYKPDTNKTLAVTANANASLSRRDRIVIRRDLAAQTIDVVRLPGTPAGGTPAAPDLTQISGGIYDVPICSFLVPPNNGTALTGFIDERGWLNPGGRGPLAFYSTAARDAHFPSPVAGDSCTVQGDHHQYTGSKWTWSRDGFFSVSSDSSGILTISHGLGVTPTTWFGMLGAQATEALNGQLKLINWPASTTSSVIAFKIYNGTTGDVFGAQPVIGYWQATV